MAHAFWASHRHAYEMKLAAEEEERKKQQANQQKPPGAAASNPTPSDDVDEDANGDGDGATITVDPHARKRPRRAPPANAASTLRQHEEKDVDVTRVKSKTLSLRRKKKKASQMGDDDIVTHGKALSNIRDIGAVYPYLSRRARCGVKAGLRSMVKGTLRTHLTKKEQVEIDKKKRHFKAAYKARGTAVNPFTGKHKRVGKTYTKFMSSVDLVTDKDSSSDSSSSDTDSASSDSESSNE